MNSFFSITALGRGSGNSVQPDGGQDSGHRRQQWQDYFHGRCVSVLLIMVYSEDAGDRGTTLRKKEESRFVRAVGPSRLTADLHRFLVSTKGMSVSVWAISLQGYKPFSALSLPPHCHAFLSPALPSVHPTLKVNPACIHLLILPPQPTRLGNFFRYVSSSFFHRTHLTSIPARASILAVLDDAIVNGHLTISDPQGTLYYGNFHKGCNDVRIQVHNDNFWLRLLLSVSSPPLSHVPMLTSSSDRVIWAVRKTSIPGVISN
jgi:hypothetical protein